MKLLGKHVKETLKYLSPRRKPGSSSLNFLALHSLRSDSGVRRNDKSVVNQSRLGQALKQGQEPSLLPHPHRDRASSG